MRPKALYAEAIGQGPGRVRRHLLRTSDPDGYPRGLCGDRVVLRDDAAVHRCNECRLVALTEIALQLDALGLAAEAVQVAAHAHDVSFETTAAQSG